MHAKILILSPCSSLCSLRTADGQALFQVLSKCQSCFGFLVVGKPAVYRKSVRFNILPFGKPDMIEWRSKYVSWYLTRKWWRHFYFILYHGPACQTLSKPYDTSIKATRCTALHIFSLSSLCLFCSPLCGPALLFHDGFRTVICDLVLTALDQEFVLVFSLYFFSPR